MKIFKYKYYGLTPFSFEEKRTRFDFKPYSTAAYGKITAQHLVMKTRNKKFSCSDSKISYIYKKISCLHKKFSFSHKKIPYVYKKNSFLYKKISCLNKNFSSSNKKNSCLNKKITYIYKIISYLNNKNSFVYWKISYMDRKFSYRIKKITASLWKWYAPQLFLTNHFASCFPVIDTAMPPIEKSITRFQFYPQCIKK